MYFIALQHLGINYALAARTTNPYKSIVKRYRGDESRDKTENLSIVVMPLSHTTPQRQNWMRSPCLNRVMQGPGSVTHQVFWLCSRGTKAKGPGAALHPQHRPGSRRVCLDSTPWDYRLWMPLGVQHTHCSTQDSRAVFITTADHQIPAGIAQPIAPSPSPFTLLHKLHASNSELKLWWLLQARAWHPAGCVWWRSAPASASRFSGPQLKGYRYWVMSSSSNVWPHHMNELVRSTCIFRTDFLEAFSTGLSLFLLISVLLF